MLAYPEDSEDLKVSLSELQEQLGISEGAGISIRQIPEQDKYENSQRFLKFSG